MRKLLFERNGFRSEDREYITAGRQQFDWWKRSVEIGFRRRYNKPRAALPAALRPMARLLYTEVLSAIQSDLRPIIEMRNTLAHGQWARPLNSDGTDIAGSMIAALGRENALSVRFKMAILERLAAIVHDLVSGDAAFERDFDQHFSRLETARRNLKVRQYADWEAMLIRKYDRGRLRRNVDL